VDGAASAEFSEFAHSRWPGLVRLGYAVTGDRGLAEDLAQTALANACASWSRVRKADDPDAYLRRIVLNAHRGSFRKRRVSERLTWSPPDTGAAAPDPAARHDDRATVLAALGTLPRRQREVLVLRYWLDLTEAQVAATLGCSVGNVKSQTSRALARLRGSAELADRGPMTIHDEQDLRAKLSSALDDLAPGPLPLDAVVRHGRMAVIRRRVTAAAVALAVAAAAALVPTLLNALHRPGPVTPYYHVTVHAPGPGSPHGLVASGRVNRARWRFFARYGARHDGLCLGSVLGSSACGGDRPGGRAGAAATLSADSGEAAQLPGGRWVRVQMVYGYVRDDVARLRVNLSNGQVLTPHPEAMFGKGYARWVAFAVPFAAAVREITVYSATAELEHAVPFTGHGSIEFGLWLRPGQPDLPRPAAGRVGSGAVQGHHWVVRGYAGPWGSCFRNATVHMDFCTTQPVVLRPGTVAKRLFVSYYSQEHIGLSVLQVRPDVSYLLVTRAKGSALRLRPQALGRQKYCVMPLDLRNQNVSWTAYDAAGHLLGNGSVSRLLG
jgi:RNA polymerase sigma-70 factor (sigma-E family)